MSESALGIILRTRPLTETSLIVTWLTPNAGRIATVAKGARRPKSPFAGKLDLFYVADFSFSRSQRSELHNLREVSVRETHSTLRNELGWLQQASYCAVLIEQTTEMDTPIPTIFELMKNFLEQLPQRPPEPKTIFAFEMKLLEELGLAPKVAESKLNPGSAKALGELTKQDWSAVSRLKLSAAQIREIKQFLHGFLIFHLGKIPKGRSAAIGISD
jgi:DNA repair protein RecO (recombination protein O)